MRCVIKCHFRLQSPLFSRKWASDVDVHLGHFDCSGWGWCVAGLCSNVSDFDFGDCIMSHCIFFSVSHHERSIFKCVKLKIVLGIIQMFICPANIFTGPTTNMIQILLARYFYICPNFFSFKWQFTQKFKIYHHLLTPILFQKCIIFLIYSTPSFCKFKILSLQQNYHISLGSPLNVVFDFFTQIIK